MSRRKSPKTKAASLDYPIAVGHGLIGHVDELLHSTRNSEGGKALIVSNEKVFGIYGPLLERTLSKSFSTEVFLMGDGEKFKTLSTAEKLLEFANRKRISRTDTVIALGGGVVGDLAGFVSAIHLRGVEFIQIPTTLLSMIDSSVGGKTAVNTSYGKNLVGAFHNPVGVVADVATLLTLPKRELIAGSYEALKHGILSGRKLFNETNVAVSGLLNFKRSDFLNGHDFLERTAQMVADQITFKAGIVLGDPFEALDRVDSKSRKILNFGHTVGHALEKVTGFRKLKHGEAVGVGMLAATEISRRLGILKPEIAERIDDAILAIGPLRGMGGVDIPSVLDSLSNDKKKIGGQLQWVLIEDLGKPLIVKGSEVSARIIKSAITKVFKRLS
jgi:3-dehydroquinate synthase